VIVVVAAHHDVPECHDDKCRKAPYQSERDYVYFSHLVSFVGSIRFSHSNAIIGGGLIIVTHSGLGAVRRRHVSQPSRQNRIGPSALEAPLQRA
jgi:hypothetical protein